MDRHDPSRLARPDHQWQQNMVHALLDSPILGDRQARALLADMIGEQLSCRVSLREQPTPLLQLLELVRFCAREEGGLPALARAVSALEGHSRTSDTVSELVRKHLAQEHLARERLLQERLVREHAAAAPAPPHASPTTPPPRETEPPYDVRDFFVSYAAADRRWAAWIAWQLEDAGYAVLVQEWDFVPGSSSPVGMERGVTRCERTIAVLSPAYLDSVHGRQKSGTVGATDPLGPALRLVPVRVAPCRPPGLPATTAPIDLVGLSAEDARTRLLEGVGASGTRRAGPALPPRFPG